MPSLSGRLTCFARVRAAAPLSGEVCPEVCPAHAIFCPRRVFIITEFACVAEQRKHSTVDRASTMDFVGASPTAGMAHKFKVQISKLIGLATHVEWLCGGVA